MPTSSSLDSTRSLVKIRVMPTQISVPTTATAMVTTMLMKKQPDFDPRNYGFSKLSKLIKSLGRFDCKAEGSDNSEYYVRDTQRSDK